MNEQESSFRTSTDDEDISDVVYNFYGNRLAFATNNKIKVFDKEENGTWREFKPHIAAGHHAQIKKLSWAHPEFGQVLATHWQTVTSHRFWPLVRLTIVSTSTNRESGAKSFKRVARSRTSALLSHTLLGLRGISDCGLYELDDRASDGPQAAASLDGRVRVYEAEDVMNLGSFSLQAEFEAERGIPVEMYLAWNMSRFNEPMMVTGSQGIKVWMYDEGKRRWGRVASDELVGQENRVTDVAWAPNLGRSYHLIAAACSNTVRIYELTEHAEDRWEMKPPKEFKVHTSNKVWRVDWNVTGTALAASLDNGQYRVWRLDMLGEWVCDDQ